MSGGVDSSVSAALLKQQGYDVTGVFIKVWQPDSTDCGWKDERRDAMRVCAVLDIPFLTFDFSEKYKKEVVDYMIAEYKAGRTPNPDIMCNRHVKFGSFLDEAKARGIDYVATGHYAQRAYDETTKTWVLQEGADKNKGQSYFLWTLGPADLERALFPIGHLQKSQVRALAKELGLPVFDKKDSQGVCFIGHLDMKAFLKEYIQTKPGNVLDSKGEIIGEHDGAVLYTLGERHGFRIFTESTAREPHYIVKKDIASNSLVVLPESEYKAGASAAADAHRTGSGQDVSVQPAQTISIQSCLFTPALLERLKDATSGSGANPLAGQTLACDVRIRYRQTRQACTISDVDMVAGTAKVTFEQRQLAMAPGQSAVFYIDETCIGGGILV